MIAADIAQRIIRASRSILRKVRWEQPFDVAHQHERKRSTIQSDQLRIPLILSEYEEKCHAEIGEMLHCSAKAVEVRIYRARKQLRATLSDLIQSL